MEKYSPPDLAPNCVFDEIDAGTSEERAADLGPSAFVDDLSKASVSLVQDAEAMDTHLACKKEFVAQSIIPQCLGSLPFHCSRRKTCP